MISRRLGNQETLENWSHEKASQEDKTYPRQIRDRNRLRWIPCKQALTRSKLTGVSHVLNPYIGCLFGCRYCYAQFMNKYHDGEEQWGSYLDVKNRLPHFLNTQLNNLSPSKKNKMQILLSSTTDLFQPVQKLQPYIEELLTVLNRNKIAYTILTKSKQVTNYLNLISESPNTEIGLSISPFEKHIKKTVEPNTPSPNQRIKTLQNLIDNKIRAYGFLGPILTNTTIEYIKDLIYQIARTGAQYILIDELTYHSYLPKEFDMSQIPQFTKELNQRRTQLKALITQASREMELPIIFAK